MKAKIINGQIKIYSQLPKHYRHWGGGFREQPTEVHEQEGFYNIVKPEFDSDIQNLGDIYFDNDNRVFTYPVVEIEIDLEVIRAEKHEEFEGILIDITSAMMFGALEKLVMGEPIPQELKDSITALRAREVEVKAGIDVITDANIMKKFKFDPVEVELSKNQLKESRGL